MPICKQCDDTFPTKLKINNKIRNLQSRKYCLTCSPFGKHNTRKLEDSNKDILCVCKLCNKQYIYDRSKGHSKTICGSCKSSEKRKRIKQKCIEYKGGKCTVCKYTKCNSALIFHHLNKEKKNFAINYAMSMAWKKIQKELDKCVLLCNRCHSEIHDGMTILPPLA